MRYKTIAMTILSLIVLAAVSSAQPGKGPGRGFRGGPPIPDLTEEQEAKIQDLKLDMKKEMLPLQTKLDALDADVKLAMTADKFDESKVSGLVKQMQEIKTQMRMKRIQHHQEVRKLLTPEQRKVFDAHLLSDRGRGRGHGDGDGRGCGKGHGPCGRRAR